MHNATIKVVIEMHTRGTTINTGLLELNRTKSLALEELYLLTTLIFPGNNQIASMAEERYKLYNAYEKGVDNKAKLITFLFVYYSIQVLFLMYFRCIQHTQEQQLPSFQMRIL